jgi:cytochrome c553
VISNRQIKIRRHASAKRLAHAAILVALTAAALAVSGCHQGMWDRGRYKPLEKAAFAPFFENGMTARSLPENVVPYGSQESGDFFYTGKIDGDYASVFPFEVNREVLERGRDRYAIFCSPCHSPIGDGNGMIVQREMKQAGNYHLPRLQESPPGYFFDVMTNGFGVMYSYASRIEPQDRWAIAAYIRVLQLSQHANVDELPPDVQDKVLNPQPESTSDEASHAAH